MQEWKFNLNEAVADPLALHHQAEAILGDRLVAIICSAEAARFFLAAPHSEADAATCANILEGATLIPLAPTPAAPVAGDNVAVAIGDAAGDYAWTWRLNGEVIDDSDASGVATVGDYVIDVAAIESGTHEIEVRKAGKYGYLRIEVT
jgi:hypothetical protein